MMDMFSYHRFLFNFLSWCSFTLLWMSWFYLALCARGSFMVSALDGGMLFPRESESRHIQDLGGMWNFRADQSPQRNKGFEEMWYKQSLEKTGPIIPMPVPSSFNDITNDISLRDFVGWVWYDRELFVPLEWMTRRVVLRVDSAHYNAIVWVNGVEVMSHSGGHLPFEAVINSVLYFTTFNLVTMAINNTLTPETLPPGTIVYQNSSDYPSGYFVQNMQMDFFNYAGLHRKVLLYSTPRTYIDDITITTDITGMTGFLNYAVVAQDWSFDHSASNAGYQSGQVGSTSVTVMVYIEDNNGLRVASGTGVSGRLIVTNVHMWLPYTMSGEDFAYLYTFVVVADSDIYRLPFGFRTVHVTGTQLLINDKPFYCHGVGKHEDIDFRGKGLDYALIARDFNMLKWLGVNCFRTTHYPYAEEIMNEADRQGIVVIDECPGVGITAHDNFGPVSLAHHIEVIDEMYRRDKNRPSVIMWSVANEPASDFDEAEPYFQTVIAHTKSLDSRPVTFATTIDKFWNNDKCVKFVDVVCINRYYGWYIDHAHLETISYKLSNDLENWYNAYQRPIMVLEYGADAVEGFHTVPSMPFSEEFQCDFLKEYHDVFDKYRNSFLIGEMVWNFADFMTKPEIYRILGNRKGILTRQRQPKMSASIIRNRYWKMINETMKIKSHRT